MVGKESQTLVPSGNESHDRKQEVGMLPNQGSCSNHTNMWKMDLSIGNKTHQWHTMRFTSWFVHSSELSMACYNQLIAEFCGIYFTNWWDDERYTYLHEWLIFMVNVGRYTIRGSYPHLFESNFLLVKKVATSNAKGCQPLVRLVLRNSYSGSHMLQVWNIYLHLA